MQAIKYKDLAKLAKYMQEQSSCVNLERFAKHCDITLKYAESFLLHAGYSRETESEGYRRVVNKE